MSAFEGRRMPDATWPDILPETEDFRDGDYWKVIGRPGYPSPTWAVFYGAPAMIPNHKVIEHEDGTISVPRPGPGEPANSILISGPKDWHGWIENGVWVPV